MLPDWRRRSAPDALVAVAIAAITLFVFLPALQGDWDQRTGQSPLRLDASGYITTLILMRSPG